MARELKHTVPATPKAGDGVAAEAHARALEERLAARDAEVEDLRAELDESSKGLLALSMELEDRVDARTAELAQTNEALRDEITRRRVAEHELRGAYDELRASQAALARADRLQTMGVMAAGVAHELNNPMMGILNFAEYAIRKVPEDNAAAPVLVDIERETRRCIDIVQNLLTFSRAHGGQKEAFREEDLSAIIDRVLRLLSYAATKVSASVSCVVDEGAPAVRVRAGELQQVVLNLVMNALDAVEGRPVREVRVTVTPKGERVELVVADSGCGIPEEEIHRVFEPFFTTKPSGRGTGLGLAICRTIAEEHGGDLSCESVAGVGTRLRLAIPVAGPQIEERTEP